MNGLRKILKIFSQSSFVLPVTWTRPLFLSVLFGLMFSFLGQDDNDVKKLKWLKILNSKSVVCCRKFWFIASHINQMFYF